MKQRPARFSLTRLWLTLALLLATNLAVEIDGFQLADVARCTCEEAEAGENGILFSRAEIGVGGIEVEEDQIYNVGVEQIRLSPAAVKWSLLDQQTGSINDEATFSFAPGVGPSTTLKLESSRFFTQSADHSLSLPVRFSPEDDPEQGVEKVLKLRIVHPRAVPYSGVSAPTSALASLNLLALGGSAVQAGHFWLRIEHSSLEREWEWVARPLNRLGFRILSVEKVEPRLFKVGYEFDPGGFDAVVLGSFVNFGAGFQFRDLADDLCSFDCFLVDVHVRLTVIQEPPG